MLHTAPPTRHLASLVPAAMLALAAPVATQFNAGGGHSFELDSTMVNVGLDIGQDDTVDACFKIPDAGITDDIVTLYAVHTDSLVPSLVAHLPSGDNAEINPEG